jgi:hypothetical protein
VNRFWQPLRPARPLVRPAFLLLTLRELYILMRSESDHALEFARGCHLEVPHANH